MYPPKKALGLSFLRIHYSNVALVDPTLGRPTRATWLQMIGCSKCSNLINEVLTSKLCPPIPPSIVTSRLPLVAWRVHPKGCAHPLSQMKWSEFKISGYLKKTTIDVWEEAASCRWATFLLRLDWLSPKMVMPFGSPRQPPHHPLGQIHQSTWPEKRSGADACDIMWCRFARCCEKGCKGVNGRVGTDFNCFQVL